MRWLEGSPRPSIWEPTRLARPGLNRELLDGIQYRTSQPTPPQTINHFASNYENFLVLESVILRSPDAFSRGDEGSLCSFDFVRKPADRDASRDLSWAK